MPTVKKSVAMRPVLDEDQINYFLTGTDFNYFWHEPEREKDWKAIRDDLLRDWIRERPGSRPWAWWLYDSLEPRLRVGGVGDLVPAYAHADNLHFGIFRNSAFVDEELLHAVGKIGAHLVPFDENDPPRYESQATYLKRRRLLARGEEERIPTEAWEPEAVR